MVSEGKLYYTALRKIFFVNILSTITEVGISLCRAGVQHDPQEKKSCARGMIVYSYLTRLVVALVQNTWLKS